jgi:hypothetical protein
MCKSPNFRQEIRSSYYRNDSLKYDLKLTFSNSKTISKIDIKYSDHTLLNDQQGGKIKLKLTTIHEYFNNIFSKYSFNNKY